MDAAAKTFIGAADNQQRLLALALHRLGFRLLKDLVVGGTVRSGLLHCALGLGELGGSDDFHRLGDLLDVLDRLEATLDLTERGEVGILEGGGDGSGRPVGGMAMSVCGMFLL